MSLRLEWAAASDPGRLRPNNEDVALAEDGLYAVADGMGGHAAGEVASRVAVEALRANTAEQGLVEAVQIANRAVYERATEDTSLRGMGTTLCAAALVDGDPPRLDVVNVGDSRVYLFRDGELGQVTEDHSLVADLEREGRLTAAEAKVHPQRNIVTRVLGNEEHVDVDVFGIEPFRGDRLLLCSDGLFDELDDDVIADVLRANRGTKPAVDELVRLANTSGGRDNITVVLVDVVDDGGRADRASTAIANEPVTKAPAVEIVELEPPEAHTGVASAIPSDHQAASPANRRRPPTWRAVLFAVAVVAVLGVAIGSLAWFARGTYYVGVKGERVTIFKGRPGGVLWLDPTVEERTDVHVDEVPPSRQKAVEEGKEQSSLAAARRYVANLEREAAELHPTTTTTTSTSTTLPPGTFAPGTTPPTTAP